LNPTLTPGRAKDSSALAVASSPVRKTVPTSSKVRVSRPDRAAYNAEQKRLTTEIDLVEKNLAAVQGKISDMNQALQRGSDNKSQPTLRAKSEDPQSQHTSNKTSPNEILDERQIEVNEFYAIRSERNSLQQQLERLVYERIQSTSRFNKAEEQYHAEQLKLDEDEPRPLERSHVQKDSEQKDSEHPPGPSSSGSSDKPNPARRGYKKLSDFFSSLTL